MERILKIKSWTEAARTVDIWHQSGYEIVFTNGCFDILHAGHIKCLRSARNLGDRLIVAVNTDASVNKLKGENRPLNTLEDRMTLLEALEFVDLVVSFDQDTPTELIQYLKPDILVKGSEYSPENIAGATDVLEWGGEVKTIPMEEGYSTTELINRIKNV